MGKLLELTPGDDSTALFVLLTYGLFLCTDVWLTLWLSQSNDDDGGEGGGANSTAGGLGALPDVAFPLIYVAVRAGAASNRRPFLGLDE